MKISSSGIKKVPRQYLSLITVRQYGRHNELHFLVNIQNCYEKILPKVLWEKRRVTSLADDQMWRSQQQIWAVWSHLLLGLTSISHSRASDGATSEGDPPGRWWPGGEWGGGGGGLFGVISRVLAGCNLTVISLVWLGGLQMAGCEMCER